MSQQPDNKRFTSPLKNHFGGDSSPMYSPPPRRFSSPISSKPSNVGDRFIPNRSSSKLEEAFGNSEFMEPSSGSGADSHGKMTHLLRTELLGHPMPEIHQETDRTSGTTTVSSGSRGSSIGSNFLKYSSPKRNSSLGNSPKPSKLDSPHTSSFGLGNSEGYAVKRSPRKISRTPYKVLDAPNLQDDYYLNLVDWSSGNILAVALGCAVYLWSPNTAKVSKLCDLGAHDSVTSITWSPNGTNLAVGTCSGHIEIWDLQQMTKIRELKGHSNRVGTLAWSSILLASGSRDRTILLQDVRIRTGGSSSGGNGNQQGSFTPLRNSAVSVNSYSSGGSRSSNSNNGNGYQRDHRGDIIGRSANGSGNTSMNSLQTAAAEQGIASMRSGGGGIGVAGNGAGMSILDCDEGEGYFGEQSYQSPPTTPLSQSKKRDAGGSIPPPLFPPESSLNKSNNLPPPAGNKQNGNGVLLPPPVPPFPINDLSPFASSTNSSINGDDDNNSNSLINQYFNAPQLTPSRQMDYSGLFSHQVRAQAHLNSAGVGDDESTSSAGLSEPVTTTTAHIARSISKRSPSKSPFSPARQQSISGLMLSPNYYNSDMHTSKPESAPCVVQELTAHKQEVCGLKWSFDERLLASGGNDNKLYVWSAQNSTAQSPDPLCKFSDHTAAVKAVAWSPHQSGLLASGGGTADRHIRFWNASTGLPLHRIDTGSQVCNLMWSKTVNEVVSTHGYSLNQIIIWKYPSMQKMATLTGHSMRVLYLAMSPDGQSVVTGAGDETLRFWNVFPEQRAPVGLKLGHSVLVPSGKDIR